MLKSLIEHGRIETTIAKAKEIRRHADRLITLSKKNNLATRRQAIAKMMLTFNSLTPKEARAAKSGNKTAWNTDRQIIDKLFGELAIRFATRNGGYTRIIRNRQRVGDDATTCYLEYLSE
jgi:large subunit ribosomal protein L17